MKKKYHTILLSSRTKRTLKTMQDVQLNQGQSFRTFTLWCLCNNLYVTVFQRLQLTYQYGDDPDGFSFHQVTDDLVIEVLYWLPLQSHQKLFKWRQTQTNQPITVFLQYVVIIDQFHTNQIKLFSMLQTKMQIHSSTIPGVSFMSG